MKNKIIKILVIMVITLIVLDQVSKLVVTGLNTNHIKSELFSVEISQNTGMTFGFNNGNGRNIILTIFVLLVIVSFIKNQIDRIDEKTICAISLIMAGGISNLIDRLFRGGIFDFIKIYKLPVFNLADVFIVTGGILLIIFLIDFTKKDIEV